MLKFKDFAKYINYKSFDEDLHKIRQKSLDGILANESANEMEGEESKKTVAKKTA